MTTIQIADLIDALNLIGECYRSKDGSKPAEAVTKVIAQLKGFEQLSLEAWKEHRKGTETGKKKRAMVDCAQIEQFLAELEATQSQTSLREKISKLERQLAAPAWKSLAKRAVGKNYPSGKSAKNAVETHFSDRILLGNRLDGIKHIHG